MIGKASNFNKDDKDVQAINALDCWKYSDFRHHNYIMKSLDDSLCKVYSTMKKDKELWKF